MVSSVEQSSVEAHIRGLLWILFLGLLYTVSFLSGGVSSQAWSVFYFSFCVWLTAYVFSIGSGVRFSKRALKRSRSTILLMGISYLWILIQLVLPFQNPLIDYLDLLSAEKEFAWAWFETSIGWSSSPERGARLALRELLCVLVLIASISIIDTRSRLKQFMLLISFIGLSHACIGLFALYGGLHLIDIKEIDGHWEVARGMFVNRNHFASLIVVCLVGSLSQLLYASSFSYRQTGGLWSKHLINVRNLFATLCLVLSLFALIESQSRGALLGLIIGVLAYLRVKGSWVVLCSMVIILLGLSFLVGDELMSRLRQGWLSFGERGDQWSVTLRAILESPYLGYGGGSYATVFQIFREQMDFRDVVFSQSHNLYLHLWLERGLIGLALWLSVLTILYIKLHSAIAKSKSLAVVSSLRAGGIVITAALIQSLVDYNLQVLNIRYLFFCVLGCMLAAPLVYQSNRKSTFSN